MNIEDAYRKALVMLELDEIPPYASTNPAVQRKRIEFTSVVGAILRDENARQRKEEDD